MNDQCGSMFGFKLSCWGYCVGGTIIGIDVLLLFAFAVFRWDEMRAAVACLPQLRWLSDCAACKSDRP